MEMFSFSVGLALHAAVFIDNKVVAVAVAASWSR
jgi:hypothetical protein